MEMVVLLLVIAAIVAVVLYRPSSRSSSDSSKQPSPKRSSPVETRSDADDGSGDAWEGSFWEAEAPYPVAARLKFRYRDANESTTERLVSVRRVGSVPGASLLIPHCHLRDATRTFRTDRISNCVDVETGEWMSDVAAYLRSKYDASPERALEQFLESDLDVLRILLFVGKADGQLRAAEKAIICETAAAMSGDSRITGEVIDRTLREVSVPTLQAFRLAIGRCAARSPEQREKLIEAAHAMVATQKSVHPAEAEAMAYMEARLGTAGTGSPSPA